MKTSLITTVFNEEKTIGVFLDSIFDQSKLPDEIIIVDGGSTDGTFEKIKKYDPPNSKNFPKIKLILKKGNRSVGRNEAINGANNEIIAITDAGCILDKNWLSNLLIPFSKQQADVVAGYYRDTAKNTFQKCLAPYVLVMEDKISEKDFLPATRSMAIKRKIWEKAGKFDERLSHNEDYAFANKLRDMGAKIVFRKDAIVNWQPRKNLKEAFIMFFRFALGDSEAKIFRDKVIYIFIRYVFAAYLLVLSLIMRSYILWVAYALMGCLYIGWSIRKNYEYVNKIGACFYLPLLQVASDIAVITGTVMGLVKKITLKSLFGLLSDHKWVVLLIFSYILMIFLVIDWGIPNLSHPFTYHMDEWHQSQAVRDLFRFGTSNIAGAANGTVFQFFLSGIYLVPFYVLGIVNPFAIKSSVMELGLQQRLFEVFRTNSILFGVLSIILVYYLAKKYFKTNGIIIAFLFTINPIWLMLSNYFKYDISLMFWILLAILFLLRYINNPKSLNFVLAGIFSGLAFSVKVSAIPLLLAYILAFFLCTPKFMSKLKTLFIGLLIFTGTIVFFGIPDIVFGKGNMIGYLQSNIIDAPTTFNNNFNFGGINDWVYFLTRIYPITFGYALYLGFLVALVTGVISIIYLLFKRKLKDFQIMHKNYLFLTLIFILFALSLYPLKSGALGNRALVLLPFIAIAVGSLLTLLLSIKNRTVAVCMALIIILVFLSQAFDSYKFFKFKMNVDTRVSSSGWIVNNIKPGETIGIENIPIYQLLPDVILKDFYLQQYSKQGENLYRYQVVNYKEKLPKVVIVTNGELESNFWIKSDRTNLTKQLIKEKYKVVQVFKPDFKYFPTLRDRFDLYLSGLVPIPDNIVIYEKQR